MSAKKSNSIRRNAVPTSAVIGTRLAKTSCEIRVGLRQYDHARQNVLVAGNHAPAAIGGKAELNLCGSFWNISTTLKPAPENSFVHDFEICFCCEKSGLKQAAVAVELEFANWSPKNYVLLPAAAYDGNRFLSRKIPYSPKLYFAQDIGPDKPVIITDVPRLNFGDGVSRIQERSGSMSVPAIGFHDPKRKKGFLFFTKQGNEFGD